MIRLAVVAAPSHAASSSRTSTAYDGSGSCAVQSSDPPGSATDPPAWTKWLPVVPRDDPPSLPPAVPAPADAYRAGLGWCLAVAVSDPHGRSNTASGTTGVSLVLLSPGVSSRPVVLRVVAEQHAQTAVDWEARMSTMHQSPCRCYRSHSFLALGGMAAKLVPVLVCWYGDPVARPMPTRVVCVGRFGVGGVDVLLLRWIVGSRVDRCEPDEAGCLVLLMMMPIQHDVGDGTQHHCPVGVVDVDDHVVVVAVGKHHEVSVVVCWTRRVRRWPMTRLTRRAVNHAAAAAAAAAVEEEEKMVVVVVEMSSLVWPMMVCSHSGCCCCCGSQWSLIQTPVPDVGAAAAAAVDRDYPSRIAIGLAHRSPSHRRDHCHLSEDGCPLG